MMSLALRSIFSDSSLTVTPSVMVISCSTSGITGGGGIAGLGGGAGTACGLGLGAVAVAEGAAPAWCLAGSTRPAGRSGAGGVPVRGPAAGREIGEEAAGEVIPPGRSPRGGGWATPVSGRAGPAIAGLWPVPWTVPETGRVALVGASPGRVVVGVTGPVVPGGRTTVPVGCGRAGEAGAVGRCTPVA